MYKIILLPILLLLTLTGCTESNDEEDTPTVTTVPIVPIVNDDKNDYNTHIQPTTNPTLRPMLVILISYKDIQVSSSVSTWSNKIFGKNESQLNHYYNEISNSQFEFSQATEYNGVASVYLDKNHPNTDIDSSLFEKSVYPDLKAALEKTDSDISFDIYDKDGNGHITPDELLITFIIAGYEDSYEGMHVTYGIWGHQSCVSSIYTPTLDGVTLMSCENDGNYAMFGEKHNKVNPHDATIGIIAHELGHSAFNLPDLYNTYNYNDGGIGYFGLMGGGTWTQKNVFEYAGETPVHMTAWSKVYTGWITPDKTNGSKVMNATSLNSFNVVKIPINSNEYYLLENRDNSGYDRGLFMLGGEFNGGLAIWKIDETKLTDYKINDNSVNNDIYNRGVDLIEAARANIDFGGNGHEKNLFYYGNVNSLSNAGVSNISVRGETMTLEVE